MAKTKSSVNTEDAQASSPSTKARLGPATHKRAYELWQKLGSVAAIAKCDGMPSAPTLRGWMSGQTECKCPYHGWAELAQDKAEKINRAIVDTAKDRATMLEAIIREILVSITPEDISGQTPLTRAKMFQIFANMQRLEQGKSTFNLAHQISAGIDIRGMFSKDEMLRIAASTDDDTMDPELIDRAMRRIADTSSDTVDVEFSVNPNSPNTIAQHIDAAQPTRTKR